MNFICPWPPKELNPNSRTHWAKKMKVAKKYRRDCYFSAKSSGLKPLKGLVLFGLIFSPPDNRKRDDDNLLAAFKSGRDGIAEALGADDNQFITQFEVRKLATCGVHVFISEIADPNF